MSNNATDLRPQDDPNVRIPAAVKASAALAEELLKSQFQNVEQTENNSDQKPEEPAKQDDVPADAKPVTQESKPPVEPSEPKQIDWQGRYNAMKGRFDRAEVVNRELTDRLAKLEDTLAFMQVQRADVRENEQKPERLITDKELEDYGEEFLTVVEKKAKETFSPEIIALKKQNESLQKKIDSLLNVEVRRTRTDMKRDLSASVPNWQEINEDQKFLEWLALTDPYSGTIKHALLKDAWDRNDSPRVVNFFKGFLEATGAQQEEKTDTPPQAKVPLESLAAPGRANTSAAMSAAPGDEKPFFTRAQIKSFYADVGSGKYRGREADKVKLETQIFEAQREGRIR